jgi:hypothetical protein
MLVGEPNLNVFILVGFGRVTPKEVPLVSKVSIFGQLVKSNIPVAIVQPFNDTLTILGELEKLNASSCVTTFLFYKYSHPSKITEVT